MARKLLSFSDMRNDPDPGRVAGSEATGLEVLSIRECQDRLRAGGVGILALCGVGVPVQRPVNFAYHAGDLLIRTGEGRILEAAHGGEPASFAISAVDPFEHTGWSVIVTGQLTEKAGTGALADVPLRPWAREPKHHFVGLSVEQVSGRRLATWTRRR